jgi:two-component system chemotaxis response regulator CheY
VKKDLTVLVVDDEPTMRFIMRRILKQMGFDNVIEASDGAQAMKCLGSDHVGLVVADWNMPKVSGLELLKAIRADPAICDMPVLMVTGEAKADQVRQALNAGATQYIVKPFTAQVFEDRIGKIVKSLP